MFYIRITPRFKDPHPNAYWESTFETMPSLRTITKRVHANASDLTTSLEAGVIEATSENKFMRDGVYPQCLFMLKHWKTPLVPTTRGRTYLLIKNEKRLGTLTVQERQ